MDMNMEELELGEGDNCNINDGHNDNGNADGVAMKSPCNGRWNPTKEQIRMLESFYGQGITTPTASQIQEITTRLQAYGHIEGKNVFYWFQNHKARQRQKQKQHHFSNYYYNHHHHLHAPLPPPLPPLPHLLHPPPPPLPPSPNVVYGGAAQSNLRFYPQYRERVLVPAAGRSTMAVKRAFIREDIGAKHNVDQRKSLANGRERENTSYMYGGDGKETLELFPLHPTGILEHAVNGPDIASGSIGNVDDGGEILSEEADPSGRNRIYFDFLSTLD